MKPFQQSYMPESEVQISQDNLRKEWKRDKLMAMLGHEFTAEELEHMIAGIAEDWKRDIIFRNNLYQVVVTDHPDKGVWELSIRRTDRQVIRDWRQLQRIKSLIIGSAHEGFEIFPAEERLVDTANQYYMWVFKDPKYRLPFGFKTRAVSSINLGKSINRSIREDRNSIPPDRGLIYSIPNFVQPDRGAQLPVLHPGHTDDCGCGIRHADEAVANAGA